MCVQIPSQFDVSISFWWMVGLGARYASHLVPRNHCWNASFHLNDFCKTYIYIYLYFYIYICKYMYIYIHICHNVYWYYYVVYVHSYIYIFTYVYIEIYLHFIDVQIYIYIYIHMYRHDILITYTHKHRILLVLVRWLTKKTTSFSVLYTVLQVGWTSLVTSPWAHWSWVGLRGAIPEGPRPHRRRAGCVGGRDHIISYHIKVFTVRMGQSRFKLQSRTFRLHGSMSMYV